MATKSGIVLESGETVILENLGDLAKDLSSRFCCGGKLLPQNIRLNYKLNAWLYFVNYSTRS